LDKKNDYWILAVILVAAFLLRCYRISDPYLFNDYGELVVAASKQYPDSPQDIIDAFQFYHGAGNLYFAYIYMTIYRILGMRITETLWNLPYILIGLTTIIAVYKISIDLFKSKKTAIISAILLAFYPTHVIYSRGSGFGHQNLGYLFHILALYFTFKYFTNPSRKKLILLSITTTLTLITDMLMPPLILSILWIGYITQKSPTRLQRIKRIINLLFKKELIIPTLILLIKVGLPILSIAYTGDSDAYGGSLVRAVSRPINKPGFYVLIYLTNMSYFLGPIGFILLSIFFLRVIYNERNLLEVKILLSWLISYSIPFLFIFPRCITGYIMSPQLPYLLIAAYGMGKLMDKRPSYRLLVILVLILIVLTSVNIIAHMIYNLDARIFSYDLPRWLYVYDFFNGCPNHMGRIGFPGRVLSDTGIKAAGYWIRKNTDPDDVLLDAAGIWYGRRTSSAYYFRRQITGFMTNHKILYIQRSDYPLFKKSVDWIDIILKYPESRDYKKDFGPFHLSAVIMKEKNPILHILTKKKYYDKPKIYSMDKLNRLFDLELTTWDEIWDPKLRSKALIITERGNMTFSFP